MTPKQKLIKYFALAFAVFLIVSLSLAAFGIIDAVLGTNIRFSGQDDHFGFVAISDNINTLEVDISASELRIVSGDSFAISSQNESVSFSENGNRFVVTDVKKFSFSSEGLVIIQIPEEKTFERVEISAGAGDIDIEKLNTSEMKMNLGAGDVYIKEIYVTKKAYISCAAGEFTVKKGAINNLETDFAVGDVELRCELSGNAEINCGIGDVSIVLPGTEENYRIEIDKGLASASINGKRVKDDTVYGEGPNRIDIGGAVGTVSVKTE